MSVFRLFDRLCSRATLAAGAALLGTAALPLGAQPAPPRLIVFITVDQMRADYLTRFAPLLTGGLARLSRGGAVFTNGFQDHGNTETAPGHSVTMSGRFPVHTGIAANSAGVGDATVKLIGSAGPGASPRRFRGTTLTDWLRAADPETRVLSVSRKDRAAILPIGKAQLPVFWYTLDGNFTTSSYYADTIPTWLNAFNARHLASSYAGRSWTPLTNDSLGTFSYTVPAQATDAAARLDAFPWMDQLTLEAALAGVRALGLGTARGGRPRTDLLAVSLSTTDAVGHMYGPDSPELRDQVLRVDAFLGAFLDTLYALRDSSTIVVTLTADHGVGPIPGKQSADPNGAGRYVNIVPLRESIRDGLKRAGVTGPGISIGNIVTFDRSALEAAHVDADSLRQVIRDSLRAMPGVLRVDRISELQHMDTTHDPIARRWLHMFDSDSLVELVVTLAPYNYWGTAPSGGEHGSPHDYDAHVPIIFYGAPFVPGRYTMPVRVVDMAPTLAAVAGVRPLEPLDGVVLRAALRH